jgi:hypothetical protein
MSSWLLMRVFPGDFRLVGGFLRLMRLVMRLMSFRGHFRVRFVRLFPRMAVFLASVRTFMPWTPFSAPFPRISAGMSAMRFVPLRLARRLDAAESATEVIQFAFIGEFLALSDFHQFQNLVNPVNHFAEGFGNFGGVNDGLVDGRGVGRAKIGGFDPRFVGPGRLGAALGAALMARRLGSGRVNRRGLGRGRFGRGRFRRIFRSVSG